jgi:hypothetical protein
MSAYPSPFNPDWRPSGASDWQGRETWRAALGRLWRLVFGKPPYFGAM